MRLLGYLGYREGHRFDVTDYVFFGSMGATALGTAACLVGAYFRSPETEDLSKKLIVSGMITVGGAYVALIITSFLLDRSPSKERDQDSLVFILS